MKAADIVARYLRDQGVPRVYGLPGGEVTPLMEALRQAGLDFVLAHHEASAAFMADAEGQMSGRPGVCVSTLGPGAMNLISGVSNAWLDRSPLLALTGEVETPQRDRMTHQILDLCSLYVPITKWSAAPVAEEFGWAVARGWSLAGSGRPGPVHLALSPTEQRREVADAAATAEGDPAPPPANLAPLVSRVEASRRIVLALGLAAREETAAGAFAGLAERWDGPVIVSPKAKGWFPEDHPLFAGVFGPWGDAPVHTLVREADLVLGVGWDGVDFIKVWPDGVPTVTLMPHFEAETAYPVELALVSPLAPALSALAETPIRSGWDGAARAAACRAQVSEALRLDPAAAVGDSPLTVQSALHILRDHMEPDDVVACDVGAHKLVMCQAWPCYRPNTFFVSNGLSAMGAAVPAALVARLSRPHGRVAAVLGDGGVLLYTGELETLARRGLPLVLMVMVDDTLNLIRVKEEREGNPAFGVDFGRPDYAALARAFGLWSATASTTAELRQALTVAFAQPGPALVAVELGSTPYVGLR